MNEIAHFPKQNFDFLHFLKKQEHPSSIKSEMSPSFLLKLNRISHEMSQLSQSVIRNKKEIPRSHSLLLKDSFQLNAIIRKEQENAAICLKEESENKERHSNIVKYSNKIFLTQNKKSSEEFKSFQNPISIRKHTQNRNCIFPAISLRNYNSFQKETNEIVCDLQQNFPKIKRPIKPMLLIFSQPKLKNSFPKLKSEVLARSEFVM